MTGIQLETHYTHMVLSNFTVRMEINNFVCAHKVQ